MALNERQQAIRQKIARGEALNPAEELEWMDAQEEQEQATEGTVEAPRREIEEDEEDTEHHDVGLRRNALNVIMIERGDMFGTAIPIHKDMNETLKELQRIVVEIYAARRAQNKV